MIKLPSLQCGRLRHIQHLQVQQRQTMRNIVFIVEVSVVVCSTMFTPIMPPINYQDRAAAGMLWDSAGLYCANEGQGTKKCTKMRSLVEGVLWFILNPPTISGPLLSE